MGYTHYFQQMRAVTSDEWNAIRQDAEKILSLASSATGRNIHIAYKYDEPNRKAEINSKEIRFNGVGENGHETFMLSKDAGPDRFGRDGYAFVFCKTARKPYDQAVGAILLSMNKHAPGAWDIGSDGGIEEEEWQRAFNLYEDALGEPADIPDWLTGE